MRSLLAPLLVPIATFWVVRQQRRILAQGVPLSTLQMEDAQALGIQYPDRVRLLMLSRVPLPLGSLARLARPLVGTSFSDTSGLTAFYGIYLRSEVAHDRNLIAHELTHTRQYETLGGVRPFLRRYLEECLTHGYFAAPLEIEAREAASRLCFGS